MEEERKVYVWVVYDNGCEDGTTVKGVYSTYEKCKEAAKKYDEECEDYIYGGYDIYEFGLDTDWGGT